MASLFAFVRGWFAVAWTLSYAFCEVCQVKARPLPGGARLLGRGLWNRLLSEDDGQVEGGEVDGQVIAFGGGEGHVSGLVNGLDEVADVEP